jgi:hypothetical protein
MMVPGPGGIPMARMPDPSMMMGPGGAMPVAPAVAPPVAPPAPAAAPSPAPATNGLLAALKAKLAKEGKDGIAAGAPAAAAPAAPAPAAEVPPAAPAAAPPAAAAPSPAASTPHGLQAALLDKLHHKTGATHADAAAPTLAPAPASSAAAPAPAPAVAPAVAAPAPAPPAAVAAVATPSPAPAPAVASTPAAVAAPPTEPVTSSTFVSEFAKTVALRASHGDPKAAAAALAKAGDFPLTDFGFPTEERNVSAAEAAASASRNSLLESLRAPGKTARFTVQEMKQAMEIVEKRLLQRGAGFWPAGARSHQLVGGRSRDDHDDRKRPGRERDRGDDRAGSGGGGQYNSDRYGSGGSGGGGGGDRDRRGGGDRGDRRGGDRRGGDRRGGGDGRRDRREDERDYTPAYVYDYFDRADNAYDRHREVDALTAITKQAKGIMNKISRETFAKLSEEMVGLNITSQEMLENVIEVTFDKALEDVFFQDLYADLFNKLGERATVWSTRYLKVAHLSGDVGSAGEGWYFDVSGAEAEADRSWQGRYDSEADARNAGMKLTNFKRLLLNRAQREFEKEDQFRPLANEQEMDEAERANAAAAGVALSAEREAELRERADARDVKRLRLKRRMLANIAFIGQLYRIEGMLTAPIMHYCIARLLNQGNIENPDEENTEALTKLLTLIGGKLAKEDAGSPTPRMGQYFELITRLSVHPKVSSRVRFACLDLIDLRRGGWVLRGAAASVERQTMTLTRDELRKLEDDKRRAEEAAKAATPRSGTGGGGGGGSVPGGRNLKAGSGGGGGSRPASGATGPSGKGPAMFGPGTKGRPSPAPSAPAAAADGWTTVGGRGGGGGGGGRGGVPAATTAPPAPAAGGAGAASAGAVSEVAMKEEILEGEALARRLLSAVKEYGTLRDAAELHLSIREIRKSPAWAAALVRAVLKNSSTADGEWRKGAALAMAALAAAPEDVRPSSRDLVQGLAEFMPTYAELAADAPKLADYAVEVRGVAPRKCHVGEGGPGGSVLRRLLHTAYCQRPGFGGRWLAGWVLRVGCVPPPVRVTRSIKHLF